MNWKKKKSWSTEAMKSILIGVVQSHFSILCSHKLYTVKLFAGCDKPTTPPEVLSE